jgi:hypothetical protein
MPPDDTPAATGNNQPFDAELRKDLAKQLAMAFPTLLIVMVVTWLKDILFKQPGRALFIIIPGIVFLAFIFVRAATRQKLKLGWPFLVFLPVYILIFYLAAATSVLDWQRSLVGHERDVPRNFLALNRYGDWHYKFAEEVDNPDLAIVLMKPPKDYQTGREQISDLLSIALASGAKGVALDFELWKYTEEKVPVEKGIDRLLCSDIKRAQEKGIPIFVGHDYELKQGRVDSVPIDPDLEKCLPAPVQGHMMGYAEWDGIVRSIPLYLENNRSLESLSLKIAKSLDPNLKVPANGLLQFIRPANEFRTVSFEDLDNSEANRSSLRGRFVLVGEESAQDSFQTPYGIKPGIVIHAYAVHSLTRDHFFERPAWWITLLMISPWCYLMMVMVSRGVRSLKLVLINLAASLFIVVISALAVYLWQTWIDLIYPLVATWLFLFLLIAWRSIGMRKTVAG